MTTSDANTLQAEQSQTQDSNAALAEVDTLLNQFTHFGVELGLERIQRLLADLGNPERQVPILHVAGSNGKGSVCAYLSSVLAEAGYRVGRYTSPHLVSWCERICLNQQEIAPGELLHLLKRVMAAIRPDCPSPTQFEVITAVAWLYFAEQHVDIAVVEVGLGGRLDATNVCDRPLVSVITSLSLEHWQKLGPTLSDITREKAGILKSRCPAVIAPQPAAATAVLKQRLAELDCPAVWVEPATDLGNGWANYQGSPSCQYPLALPGLHQLTNSAVAIATLQTLQQQGWRITPQQIEQGMAKTQWQGRLQWLTWHNYPILIDGAHNPAGAEMLRHYIDHSDRVTHPICWVIGMLSTKDHADVFRALLRRGDRLFLVPVPDHLSADLASLTEIAQTVCPGLAESKQYDDVMAGLKAAVQANQAAPSTIVLCGSLYLIGHFFQQPSDIISG
ncbi:MAG: folylpolyglutamate synthase/dihydrofolate synthase family protein [Elainellaceae cyanobacterium]